MISIDADSRQRLTNRFGPDVATWFDELPELLARLAEQWQIQLGDQIPRGSVSMVFRCRTNDGQAAVMKTSPDLARIAFEATALGAWQAVHTPAVLSVDERLGAMLIEAIEPGTPLDVTAAYPPARAIAGLLEALRTAGTPDPSYPIVAQRVAYLFDSSVKLYERHPELEKVVPKRLYESGRRLAARQAQDPVPTVLLHGDLTPSNILDGGTKRGLVAVDPAPCVGDAAFDAVDLILWQADSRDVIESRIHQLAEVSGPDAERYRAWCTAFAAMSALELASSADYVPVRLEVLLQLAADAAAIQ